MRITTMAILGGVAAFSWGVTARAGDAIPEHPEKLVYPGIDFKLPLASELRAELNRRLHRRRPHASYV